MKNLFQILFLSLLIGSGSLFSQRNMTPEDLWSFGRVSNPIVSPNGKKILYGVSYVNIEEDRSNRNLYVTDVEAAKSTRLKGTSGKTMQLTETSVNEYNECWRPDGQAIAFISSESGDAQIWEMDTQGKNRKQVSEIEGGLNGFVYSPDMKHVAFIKDVKMDKTVQDMYPDLPKANARIIDDLMYRHWSAWHDFSYSHVFIATYENGKVTGTPVDIMEGERFDAPLPPFGGMEQITWNADGSKLVYTCKKKSGKDFAVSTNSDLYEYDLASKKTRNLTEGMMGYDTEPTFSPDGKSLAWLSMERDGYESDKNRIYVMDLSSGKKTDLSANWDNSAGHLRWSADSKTIFFTAAVKATYQMHRLSVADKNIQQLTFGDHNYGSVEPAGKSLVGRRCSMSAPHEIFKVSPETGKQSPLTKVNTTMLDEIEMGEVKERTVKTTDGKDMKVWVIYPPNFDENKKYPTLLYCQGGPQSAVSQFWSYRWNFQMMAANGYVIVAPNRRGLPSFGQEWNEQISGDWGGQAMEDYLAAIDDVSKESYVNKDKLGAVGASYGGYSVYYLAGNHDGRFKTFISHCGLFNLEAWYGATEELFFANFDLKGAYWDNPQPASYEKFSPHKFVKNWDTPMLVIHGQKDFRVPVTEGMQAFTAAKLKDIPSRFLYFPQEGHWVQRPQNGILWQRVFFEWLDSYLK